MDQRAGRRSKALLRLVALLVLVVSVPAVAAGCSAPATTNDPSPPPSETPSRPPSVSAEPGQTRAPTTAGAAPIPTATEATVDLPPEPPTAVLVTKDAEVDGDIGSFSWIDSGTAAPWLPGNGPVGVAPGERVSVRLEPFVAPTQWTVGAGRPGTMGVPTTAVTAGTGDVAFAVDLPPGSWELAVFVQFGGTGSASYYWTVDVRG